MNLRRMGQEWVLYGCVLMSVQLIFLWTHCKKIISRESSYDWKKIVLNINMISTVVVVPLIALLLIKLSHLAGISQDAPKIMLIVFLAVITPSASAVTQMCQVYGNDSKYTSAINVITTLSAIVTMPVMVLLSENVIL